MQTHAPKHRSLKNAKLTTELAKVKMQGSQRSTIISASPHKWPPAITAEYDEAAQVAYTKKQICLAQQVETDIEWFFESYTPRNEDCEQTTRLNLERFMNAPLLLWAKVDKIALPCAVKEKIESEVCFLKQVALRHYASLKTEPPHSVAEAYAD